MHSCRTVFGLGMGHPGSSYSPVLSNLSANDIILASGSPELPPAGFGTYIRFPPMPENMNNPFSMQDCHPTGEYDSDWPLLSHLFYSLPACAFCPMRPFSLLVHCLRQWERARVLGSISACHVTPVACHFHQGVLAPMLLTCAGS